MTTLLVEVHSSNENEGEISEYKSKRNQNLPSVTMETSHKVHTVILLSLLIIIVALDSGVREACFSSVGRVISGVNESYSKINQTLKNGAF